MKKPESRPTEGWLFCLGCDFGKRLYGLADIRPVAGRAYEPQPVERLQELQDLLPPA